MSSRAASIVVGLCCLLIYNLNLRAIAAGDTYPARYLPFAIVKYHTVFLEPVATVAAQGNGSKAYWMLPRPDGHIISLYPIVTPLLVSPLYIPAVIYLNQVGWTDAQLDYVARIMEKVAASIVAALSAALLYLLLLRRADRRTALLLTIAYAFGTTTWVVSSQALWQHGLAELLVIGALLLLTSAPTTGRVVILGLCLGLIAANRPPDIIIAGALGLYGLRWATRERMATLTCIAALPIVALLLYNFRVAGNPAGGYGLAGTAAFFSHDLLTGLAGMFVSPTKGLLIYSPFFVFLVLVWRRLPRAVDDRLLTFAMAAAAIVQVLMYAKSDWRGGQSWGPRYFTDLLPLFMLLLVPVVATLGRVGRAGFHLTVAIAVLIQTIGAFAYSDSIDEPTLAADRAGVHDMRPAFQWRNSAILKAVQQGLRAPDLMVAARGSIDAIEAGSSATTVVTAGDVVSVTGWALTGDRTPLQVVVDIDGERRLIARDFFDREDVRHAFNVPHLAGWRVPLDTAGLSPGVHRLTALAWASAGGVAKLFADRPFTIQLAADRDAARTADLEEAAGVATTRIREHQQADGSWLTTFTSATTFRDPGREMNTFTTAVLLDLLRPLAGTRSLAENLLRARQHLTAQIEAGGLVRYHGLPNGPGIGTLGCAITPDTDNTALVWRLAPDSDRTRLGLALATISRFRTNDGLYRTWLASQDRFECIDPGADPDPADIVIQFHLLQLLATERPAEAGALCRAVRATKDDDRVWVYYRKAPLLALLRLDDVRDAGCAVDLPARRLQTTVPEQQIWVSVATMLRDEPGGNVQIDATLIRSVLRELARDDFALVRANPPLLYHNDLSASVSRYYWSEDVGYTLWLKLYAQYQRHAAHDVSH